MKCFLFVEVVFFTIFVFLCQYVQVHCGHDFEFSSIDQHLATELDSFSIFWGRAETSTYLYF